MAISFDAGNKLITLSAGTTTLSVIDLWSRWGDWLSISDNSKYLPAFRQVGADPIDAAAGTSIPTYIFLLNGWKIKPQEANHTLNVTGGILVVDGGGDPFVNTAGNYNVRINYSQPVQGIAVSTSGGGGLTTEQAVALSLASTEATKARKMQTNKAVVSGDGLSVNIYDDDGTTLLHSFAVSSDKNTRIPA